MNERQTCRECGAEVPGGILRGLCGKCMAKVLLTAPSAYPAPGQIKPEESAASDSPLKPLGSSRLRQFGDYELLEEIARGGMGVVFKARQLSLDRVVAVKMILGGMFASAESIRRFQAEARTLAHLLHPNIVAVHEVGEQAGQPYFSMDYVGGQNLAALVERKPLSPEVAARYSRQVAEAVHFAHQHGVLHRDLKPANVIIDADDEPQITDFGLAKWLNDDQPVTMTGQVLGSPGYLAPEQADGRRREVGVASDVYALGALLYHLLTGRPPFQAETIAATLVQVLEAEPTAPRKLNPIIPRDLEVVCLKCLQKEPSTRYASAAAVAEDLRRWEAGKAILARRTPHSQRIWSWCRRHWAAAGLSAALIVFCLAGFTSWVWHAGELRRLEHAAELLYISIGQSIYLSDSQARQLIKLPIAGGLPSLSPGGRQLAYLVSEGEVGALYISRLDGTSKQKIADNVVDHGWLNDHTLLYEPPNMQGVWSIDLRTRAKRQLFDWRQVRENGYAGGLALSPDHTWLLCNPQDGVNAATADMFICDLRGENVQTVWKDADSPTADGVRFWLRGDRFIWARAAVAGNGPGSFETAIVAYRLGDTRLQALTDWHGRKMPIAVSPDGKLILFTRQAFRSNGTTDTSPANPPDQSPYELWIMNSDGTNQRRFSERIGPSPIGFSACWFGRPSLANFTARGP